MFQILAKTINLRKLAKTNPELFDFSKLSAADKIYLLIDNAEFEYVFGLDQFTPDEKVDIIIRARSQSLKDKVALADSEIDLISGDSYSKLLENNFTKYAKKSRFVRLSKKVQLEFIVKNPHWASNNLDAMPVFTSEILVDLSRTAPWFIDKHITDYTGLSTYAEFWINMISRDHTYKKIFLDNTASALNKTEVRRVVRRFPELIMLITVDTFSKSKLSVKEWIFLISGLMDTKAFENWTFDPEVAEIMKLDLMADILSGKLKTSKRFQNAMRIVLADKQEESLDEEYIEDMKNEDTTMVGPSP